MDPLETWGRGCGEQDYRHCVSSTPARLLESAHCAIPVRGPGSSSARSQSAREIGLADIARDQPDRSVGPHRRRADPIQCRADQRRLGPRNARGGLSMLHLPGPVKRSRTPDPGSRRESAPKARFGRTRSVAGSAFSAPDLRLDAGKNHCNRRARIPSRFMR